MKTYQIRDTNEYTGGVTSEVVYDALTPRPFGDYATLDDCIIAHDDVAWTIVTDQMREEDEISGDILAIGTAIPDGQEG